MRKVWGPLVTYGVLHCKRIQYQTQSVLNLENSLMVSARLVSRMHIVRLMYGICWV